MRYAANYGTMGKLHTKVAIPENLDMHAYCKKELKETKYSLYAMAMHIGDSLNSGHYTA